jgi:hypothetical protein
LRNDCAECIMELLEMSGPAQIMKTNLTYLSPLEF